MNSRLDDFAAELAELVAPKLAALLAEREPAPLLSASQAAQRLGVSRSTVYAMVKDGRLSAVQLGGGSRPRLRFRPEDLNGPLAGSDRRE